MERPQSAPQEAPIRLAEWLSGYSANHLRRMQAGLGFSEELAAAEPEVAKWLGTPRFSIAEMGGPRSGVRTGKRRFWMPRSKPVLRYQSLWAAFHGVAVAGASPPSRAKRAARLFQDSWLCPGTWCNLR